MASSGVDIVSVADMKQQLRIPTGSVKHDAMIGRQIEQAASFIAAAIDRPIVAENETFEIEPAADSDGALFIPGRYVSAVSEIRYWTPAGTLRLDPDGTIANLGRFRAAGARGAYQWPPAGGWPETLDGSRYELDITREFDPATKAARAIAAALVVLVRQLYDGHREMRRTHAVNSLLDPYFPLS